MTATDPDAQQPPTVPPAPPPRPKRGIGLMGRLRAYFLAGVLVTAPIATTVYIAWWFISYIDGSIRPLIPARYNPENYLPFSIPGIGLLVVFLVLTLIGAFTAGYVGRLVVRLGEGVVARMPVVRGLYGATKQIVETVLAKKSAAFREVVAVEYPRRGVWSLGFITGPAHPQVQRLSPDEEMVNVFIPCAPPTAGYLLMVPRSEVRHLDMPPEEGLKLVVSGGIVAQPGAARPSAAVTGQDGAAKDPAPEQPPFQGPGSAPS